MGEARNDGLYYLNWGSEYFNKCVRNSVYGNCPCHPVKNEQYTYFISWRQDERTEDVATAISEFDRFLLCSDRHYGAGVLPFLSGEDRIVVELANNLLSTPVR